MRPRGAYVMGRDMSGPVRGGASTVRQALIAGVIDELTLEIAPVLLGSGERILDGIESFGFEPVEVLHSPLTTHIRYRRVGLISTRRALTWSGQSSGGSSPGSAACAVTASSGLAIRTLSM